MKHFHAVVLAMALPLCCLASAVAQDKAAPDKTAPAPAPTVATTFDKQLSHLEESLVGVAEAMPEDKYNYVPTQGKFEGVRDFGTEVRHVATGTYMFAATILGEKPPLNLEGPNGPANLKSKADSVKYLKDSFAYAHKALASLNQETMLASIPPPFGKNPTTRLAVAISMVSHPWDHYGQMIEYLRANSVVPPGSK